MALPGVSVLSRASAAGSTPPSRAPLQSFVDPFDPIVALLIVAVDRPFHGRDPFVSHIRAAGDVFLVPEEEVELMLLTDHAEQPLMRVVQLLLVPAPDRFPVQVGDLAHDRACFAQHVWLFRGLVRSCCPAALMAVGGRRRPARWSRLSGPAGQRGDGLGGTAGRWHKADWAPPNPVRIPQWTCTIRAMAKSAATQRTAARRAP